MTCVAPRREQFGTSVYANSYIPDSSSCFEPCPTPRVASPSRRWLLKVGEKLRLVGRRLGKSKSSVDPLTLSSSISVSSVSLVSTVDHLFVYSPHSSAATSTSQSPLAGAATITPAGAPPTRDKFVHELHKDYLKSRDPHQVLNAKNTQEIVAPNEAPDLSFSHTMSGSMGSPVTAGSDADPPDSSTAVGPDHPTGGKNDKSTHDSKPVDDEDQEDLSEEEKFNPGYREWKKRHREWTQGSYSSNPKPSIIASVPETLYPNIYDAMVKHSRNLKEPMNLADAIRVIKAGWVADGTWPTQK